MAQPAGYDMGAAYRPPGPFGAYPGAPGPPPMQQQQQQQQQPQQRQAPLDAYQEGGWHNATAPPPSGRRGSHENNVPINPITNRPVTYADPRRGDKAEASRQYAQDLQRQMEEKRQSKQQEKAYYSYASDSRQPVGEMRVCLPAIPAPLPALTRHARHMTHTAARRTAGWRGHAAVALLE
jgi:hypothetical protein